MFYTAKIDKTLLAKTLLIRTFNIAIACTICINIFLNKLSFERFSRKQLLNNKINDLIMIQIV